MTAFFGCLFLLSNVAFADATVTIKTMGKTKTFTRQQLLSSNQVKTLVVERDPAYPGRQMRYLAIPLVTLFAGVPMNETNTLLFHCLDGFSAPISMARVLNSDPAKSVAYLAIEPKLKKWPVIKDGKTAGPFYIVWENPKASNIGSEEWPFQVNGFEVKDSFETQFPRTRPDPAQTAESAVGRGYLAFQKSCFACHRLNGDGTSHMGPDLNFPLSPTEYLRDGMVQRLVRNPQSLRSWPEAKMPALNQEALSDQDLENVVAYLKHMAQRKPKIDNLSGNSLPN